MPECVAERKSDLLASRWAVLLWWAPWALVIIGIFTGNAARAVLWTVGFAVTGGACVANARHCGRWHCFFTGPLYLLAALASLLYGVGVLPLGFNGWDWIVGIALVASLLLCCVLEPLLGKYTAAH